MPSLEIYNQTIEEAKRFIEKAELAKANYDSFGNKYSASAKRASMDLSRQLAIFRRGY